MEAPSIKTFLSSDGPLAKIVEGFNHRPDQVRLALKMEETLGNGLILLAEAGTGTGKTLAYLLPAILSGRKLIISTATKTLQTQILERETPLLEKALGRPLSVVLLKGRENYLCLRRFNRYASQHSLGLGAMTDHLFEWAEKTKTGDKEELSELPEDFEAWRKVCATSESCLGSKCREHEFCHLQARRKDAARAQIVVVNHHLFFADLALRTSTGGEVLPAYSGVILDEAQHIEQVATQYFGIKVSSGRVTELIRDCAPLLGISKKNQPAKPTEALEELEKASASFWGSLGPSSTNSLRVFKGFDGEIGRRLGLLIKALENLTMVMRDHGPSDEEGEGIAKRITLLLDDLGLFLTPTKPGEVRWFEPRGRTTFLHSVPVDVSKTLSEALFTGKKPVVLTSATLRVGGSFAYIRSRLGVPEEAGEIAVDGPFDYEKQCLIYIPEKMANPNDGNFSSAAAKEVAQILEITKGRAFCLFTSHRVLREVAARLKNLKLPYKLLVQGEAPRDVLLDRFREDVHSVLLGAQAFWEGVDVPGEALSAVIIDKLPFSSPGDPLVEARIEKIRDEGSSPFNRYQLPMAAMSLRQGVGRLIRRMGDRGIVAILDSRISTKNYGGFLRKSLPPAKITRTIEDINSFFS